MLLCCRGAVSQQSILRSELVLSSENHLSTAARNPELNDAALIAAVRAGNQKAMAQLYDRYAGVVYSVALRVLGETAAAEDVLQEIFMQLWRSPGSFDASRGNLAPWLAVIARNRAVDVLRKRRPQAEISETLISIEPDLAGETERGRTAEKCGPRYRRWPCHCARRLRWHTTKATPIRKYQRKRESRWERSRRAFVRA